MNVKLNFIAVLVLLTSFVMIVQSFPFDILSQLTDDSERQMMKRLAEYLSNDYSDESSSSSYSNGVITRGVSARQENCRLPMKRGLCRALLPRWRWDYWRMMGVKMGSVWVKNWSFGGTCPQFSDILKCFDEYLKFCFWFIY